MCSHFRLRHRNDSSVVDLNVNLWRQQKTACFELSNSVISAQEQWKSRYSCKDVGPVSAIVIIFQIISFLRIRKILFRASYAFFVCSICEPLYFFNLCYLFVFEITDVLIIYPRFIHFAPHESSSHLFFRLRSYDISLRRRRGK